MKSLNLKTLRIFETVATCGSFSRAAEQLEMTQPAVSMHIRQLEEEVGTALFDRQRRQRMTDAGRELLQHARIIGAQVRAAEASLLAYSGDPQDSGTRGHRGLLHIGVRAVERATKSFDRRLQAGVVEATALVVCEGSEQRGAHAFVLLVHQTASESLGRSVLDVIGSPVSGAASAAPGQKLRSRRWRRSRGADPGN